jgi:glycerol kinase
VPDTNGVYFVPAFVGLAAPYWDPYARGTIVGLTRGANRDHLIRAALEAICYQIRDVVTLMEQDAGIAATEIRADGGAACNDFLVQLQADLLDVPVVRPTVIESTARGAAFLAGLATGFWRDRAELSGLYRVERTFTPDMPRERRDAMYAGWLKAVGRSRDWENH